VLGTFERFIGILIENCAGKFPLWLAPVQMVVAPITNDFDNYALDVVAKLKSHGFRVKEDLAHEKINAKIREHSLKKVPYILAVGGREKESGSVAVRTFGQEGQKVMGLEEFIFMAKERVKDKI
jgi:threonyl-tRNA synthetase